MKKNNHLVKLIAILLIASLCAPISAQAATPETAAPMASNYLMTCDTYICAVGGGDLEIWFEVTGTRTLENIGAITIYLYESTDNSNFYWVKTFHFTDYDNMMWHNHYHCLDYVPYEGVPGRYYKAYVQIWAGPESGGDSRNIWTPVERCT